MVKIVGISCDKSLSPNFSRAKSMVFVKPDFF